MPIQAGRTWFGKLSFQCYFRRMETAPSIDPTAWTQDLLASLGRANASNQHSLQIIGHDPVIAPTLRAGEAAAAVLAANATAAADLWCARGGRPQRIEVDVRAAAASLVSFLYLRYQGATLDRRGQATTAPYRARDGRWVHLHGGFSSREGTLAVLNCDDDAAAIAKAVASWDAQTLEDALAERRVCGAKLRSADEWRVHPQGIALAQVPVVEILRLDDADREPLPGPRADARGARPLSGVRALDLTRVLAGPTCARTLAEHGAEVLHVRSPKLPSIEPFVIDTNPGKRSCYLDLDSKSDIDQLRTLVRDAHVFSQGYRPGALARRGFSPKEMAEMRPGIIVVSIDCYGHAGDEHPALVPAAINDYTTGYLGALGVMSALARRTAEGGSWHVRVSLSRPAMWIMSLPRVAADAKPGGFDVASISPWIIEMNTAWGPLTRLGPIARMSETPPRWDLPPAPLGSDPPAWS